MTDLLDSIRAELRTRLDQLRPLIREYGRLQEAEQAFGDGSATSSERAGRSRRGGSRARPGDDRRAGSRRRSNSAAERQANREKVLGLVRDRPGITRAELRDAAGLSSASVAQKLRRMVDQGQVREEPLPGGATGYRIGDGQTEPTASDRERETDQ